MKYKYSCFFWHICRKNFPHWEKMWFITEYWGQKWPFNVILNSKKLGKFNHVFRITYTISLKKFVVPFEFTRGLLVKCSYFITVHINVQFRWVKRQVQQVYKNWFNNIKINDAAFTASFDVNRITIFNQKKIGPISGVKNLAPDFIFSRACSSGAAYLHTSVCLLVCLLAVRLIFHAKKLTPGGSINRTLLKETWFNDTCLKETWLHDTYLNDTKIYVYDTFPVIRLINAKNKQII